MKRQYFTKWFTAFKVNCVVNRSSKTLYNWKDIRHFIMDSFSKDFPQLFQYIFKGLSFQDTFQGFKGLKVQETGIESLRNLWRLNRCCNSNLKEKEVTLPKIQRFKEICFKISQTNNLGKKLFSFKHYTLIQLILELFVYLSE